MMRQPATYAEPIHKAVPATGERLPVVGLGTNGFSEAISGQLRECLLHFTAAGAVMLDTAAVYGESEQVIGRLMAELQLRQRLFIATKITAGASSSANPQPGGLASFERSLARLQVPAVDLLYVHNMIGLEELMPQMLEWRKAGRLRYLGISTSRDEHHGAFVECMRKYPLDFVQVNYGLGGRLAEPTVLKTAAARGVAVVANIPLGGRGSQQLQTVRDRPLPDWAVELGCTSWVQLLLKYALSHPAVTCVISGSTRALHVDDNLRAGTGALPDAGMRRRMEQFWDSPG